MTYVGRFAPSPTGPLHIGSLTAAVASFVHAKQSRGEWLVRIEDIDPPREAPGAADRILHTLETFELTWDRSVIYQSARLEIYRQTADALLRSGHAFLCSCTRSMLRAAGKVHAARCAGTCRDATQHDLPTAIRVRVEPGEQTYVDGLQGLQRGDLSAASGDYVIFRKDGLPAYHLAVVVDDAAQGVTTVVRGVDLLASTMTHLHLQDKLGLPAPDYFHLPVITNEQGQKLSKQTKATPIDVTAVRDIAARVLEYLGLAVPATLRGESPGTLWAWAIADWRIDFLMGKTKLPELELFRPPEVN